MKKTLIYIVIIAIVIALGITVGVNLEKDDKKAPTISGKVENKTESKIENKIENTTKNETQNNNSENIVENEQPENGEQDKVNEPKTDLEKAIDIAQNEWGVDNSVKYVNETEEGAPEGEFIICIREKSTTKALIWYKININDGTCEEW